MTAGPRSTSSATGSSVSRIQAALRTMAARGREVVPVPPFTAYVDPHEPLRFHNYAVPDGDVEPDARAVEALRAAFRARDRLPRLEWVEEVAPRVAPALAAAGMAEELRTPLMACDEGRLRDARAELDGLTVARASRADARDFAVVQRAAFGQEPLRADETPRDPGARGGGAVLARIDGEPAAVAAWTPVVDGVSEIVGVATAERWRRRRLAGVLTAAAARGAFAAGASLCVLTPGGEEAQRVYERAGFARLATMLHWSDPD